MRNKIFLLSFSILLLFALRADAATYTVKAGGGGNYTTVSACAAVAVAGDTCVVYAGTYSETPSLSRSGTAASPITFSVNPGDCVTIHGFNLASGLSYVTIGTPSSSTCTTSGFSYSGFQVTGSPISFSTANHITIQNNYVHDVSAICLSGPGTINQGTTTYFYVLNNTFTSCGGPGGLAGGIGMEGNHWLIDGNSFSHVEDGIYLYGSYLVVRNNNFGPVTQAEQGSNHPDAIESSCTAGSDYPLQHMLFEGNTIHDWRDSDGHGLLLRDTQQCGQTQNVMRYNQVYNIGSDFIANDVDSTQEIIYNNSISNVEMDLLPKGYSSLVFTNGDTGANVINNILVDNWMAGSADYCIYVDGASASGFVENHNLCFLTGYSGSWQNPNAAYSATDIFNKNPLFTNPLGDLHVGTGSPAIGAGGPLTTATSAGTNSTSLTVANAAFFSDGYGLTGVQGDWIRIGASTTVQIASVNFSTNVLTLATPATWSSGTSVYLYKDSRGNTVLNGANPDLGAFPSGTASSAPPAPVPPTNISISVQ
jgi:hypothetical protein